MVRSEPSTRGGYLNPDILDEVLKYVYLPEDVRTSYREHSKP
jgi:hypothetical protein